MSTNTAQHITKRKCSERYVKPKFLQNNQEKQKKLLFSILKAEKYHISFFLYNKHKAQKNLFLRHSFKCLKNRFLYFIPKRTLLSYFLSKRNNPRNTLAKTSKPKIIISISRYFENIFTHIRYSRVVGK